MDVTNRLDMVLVLGSLAYICTGYETIFFISEGCKVKATATRLLTSEEEDVWSGSGSISSKRLKTM